MISHEISGFVARIRLDDDGTRNALGMAGWTGIADAIAAVAASDARVLLLSGTPRAFCSGSNLTELAALADDPAARAPFRLAMRAAMDPLRAIPIPTIAVIDGDCFGGGVALALACDIRIAGTAARFAITPAKLGVSYPQEDVARLAAAVGRGQAARLLFGAGTIDAAEAARIGLVELVVPSASTEADALAAAIADNAPGSIAQLKAILGSDGGRHDAAFDRNFDDNLDGRAFREGVAAFRERRKARFS